MASQLTVLSTEHYPIPKIETAEKDNSHRSNVPDLRNADQSIKEWILLNKALLPSSSSLSLCRFGRWYSCPFVGKPYGTHTSRLCVSQTGEQTSLKAFQSCSSGQSHLLGMGLYFNEPRVLNQVSLFRHNYL